MPVTGLLHVAVKTNDLAATIRFYCDVVGLIEAARPNFSYPGAWLACPEGGAIIHVYAGGPALGDSGRAPSGTSAIDHVSLTASGFHEYIGRFQARGMDWREFKVPGTSLWQLFVYDPSGVQLELTFDGAAESGPEPDVSEERGYVAGRSFFRSAVTAA